MLVKSVSWGFLCLAMMLPSEQGCQGVCTPSQGSWKSCRVPCQTAGSTPREYFSARRIQHSPVHPSRAAGAPVHQPEALVLAISAEMPRRRDSRWEQLRFPGCHTLHLLLKTLKCYPWAQENRGTLPCWCWQAGIPLQEGINRLLYTPQGLCTSQENFLA